MDASMRPRHHTAENLAEGCCARENNCARFNEAAASHRGKRQIAHVELVISAGFNEAAASHRGKLSKPAVALRILVRLQ